jgi:2-keto-4-pentenoate hydratase/2-oxohepta-3-ene-1,7-dioic acid hydratase in catechol pathway
MEIARAQVDGMPVYGSVADGFFHPIDDIFGDSSALKEPMRIEKLDFLPPANPSKIIAVADAFGSGTGGKPRPPILFLKAPSSIVADGMPIMYPRLLSGPLLAEAELALIIGCRGSQVSPAEASRIILGFIAANDVTASEWMYKDPFLCKSFDSFCPVASRIQTGVDLSRIDEGLRITTLVNGTVCQEGNTRDYQCSPAEVVSRASMVTTLVPGDMILLGTPPGPPEIWPNDQVEISVEAIGAIRNEVLRSFRTDEPFR